MQGVGEPVNLAPRLGGQGAVYGLVSSDLPFWHGLACGIAKRANVAGSASKNISQALDKMEFFGMVYPAQPLLRKAGTAFAELVAGDLLLARARG